MSGDDYAVRYVDGEQRLKHGYTNATSTDGWTVIKRYLGPDGYARQVNEVAALTGLAGQFPVPPLLAVTDGQIEVGWMQGVPGQELLERRPEDVLFSVGRTGHQLHQLPRLKADSPAAEAAYPPGVVLVHGDFGPQNMLFDPDSAAVTAVLDWELADRGNFIEDLAWAEWIVRFHHAELTFALPALFEGYGERPPWPRRHQAMLSKCQFALEFVRRWWPHDEMGAAALWQQRIETTASFRE